MKCPKLERQSPRGVRIGHKMVLLPPELLTEILLRVPVKDLVRFKCVCKSWFSLISDPHFTKSHFELGVARTERLVFIAPFVPKTLSIDLNAPLHDDSASVALKVKFLPPTQVRIVGCCRGFLLLNCSHLQCLWVWNPSTGAHKFVNWSPVAKGYSPFLHGLGYDPSTDDYLVVQFQAFYDLLRPRTSPNDLASRGKFFSLRANVWQEIEAAPAHLCCVRYPHNYSNEAGWFLNGAIHWLTFNYDVSRIVIDAFDLAGRSFSDIPLPVDFDANNCRGYLLGVRGESLSLTVVWWDFRVELWVMEEYKVESSWTKIIAGPVDEIPNHARYFFPICSTKSGEIVATNNLDIVVKCDDQGRLQEQRTYCNNPGIQVAVAVYPESLLSLPCDGEQAGEDD